MKRIYYYDNLKGILILFVVLWHTLNVCSSYYGFNNNISIILSFFMIPLFIFTTGKFAKKSSKSPIKRALKMFLIFIVAQILVTLFFKYVLGILDSDASLLEPRYTLWYLITCSFMYLSEYLFRNKDFKFMFIISLIIGIFVGFVSFINDTLSISRTICFLPFFILGYYSDEIKLEERIRNKSTIISLITLGITIWFLINPDYFFFKDTYLKYSFYTYDEPINAFVRRIILYGIFFIFSMFILLVIPKNKTFLAYFGTTSLMIYLMHGVILKTIKTNKYFIDDALLGSIVLYLSVLFLCLSISYVVKNVKFKNINLKERVKLIDIAKIKEKMIE